MRRTHIPLVLTLGLLAATATPRAHAQIPPVVTQQPADQTVEAGGTATFTANATGYDSVVWQVSTNGGSTFNNLANGGVYSGATTTTLTVTGVTSAMNGYQYRAMFIHNNFIFPGMFDTTNTNAATLTVTEPSSGTTTSDARQAFTAATYACLCAYEAYLDGDCSFTVFYAAYLAWVTAQEAIDLVNAGDADGAASKWDAVHVYANYAWNFGLSDYLASGNPWLYYVCVYSYYAAYYAQLGGTSG